MLQHLLPLSVGIGLVINLFITELFGVASGGFVVPGYFALSLSEPNRMLITILVALATWIVMRILSRCIILYGRRRITLSILVGYLCANLASRTMLLPMIQSHLVWEEYATLNFDAIGFVIPGLLALSFERQGIYETLCVLCISSILIHLILSFYILTPVVI